MSGTTYNSAAFRLAQPVKLLHDRAWSVEWQSEGTVTDGTFLLAAAILGVFVMRRRNEEAQKAAEDENESQE